MSSYESDVDFPPLRRVFQIGIGIMLLGALAAILRISKLKEILPYDNIIRSTVFLTVYSGDRVANGTGVVIKDSQRIITAGHMLDDVNMVEVTEITGSAYLLDDWHKQQVRDIGYITFVNEVDVGVEVSTAPITVGDAVWLCGHIAGDEYAWSLTHGIISRVVGDEIYTDCAGYPGCSGGGLFTKDGKLIGIIVQGSPGVITKALRITQ